MRGVEARRQKAERGDLVAGVPVGYREGEDGRLEKTPDARVRHVIELIFAKFFELGSARQVMLWMRESQIQAPVNRDRRGRVVWKDVSSDLIYRTLNNPAYAGAYVYGRTKLGTRVRIGISNCKFRPWGAPWDWHVPRSVAAPGEACAPDDPLETAT